MAAVIYAAFNGQTDPLIPLFAIGVFLAFTLAQNEFLYALIFLTQTNIMTWLILGSGVVLIALSLPYALPELIRLIPRGGRTQAA